MKIIMTKIIMLFMLFLCINCNSKKSEEQKSLGEDIKQTKEYKKKSLKIETINSDFVTGITLESDAINFTIYYLKNKEISYLKLSKSDDYKPVGFCINTTTLEDAINQIKLFRKDSFYYLMIPTCTEELPIFHVVKFDNLSYFKDLGIFAFKYNEQIFKLGHFKNIEYNIVDGNSGINIIGTLSRQKNYLSDITKFENNGQIKIDDLNYINEIILNSKNEKEKIERYIDKKFIVDKINKGEGLFTSNNLNKLFNLKNETYNNGLSYINIDQEYHLETINIIDKSLNVIKYTYVLSFKKDILCDTLKINKELVIDNNITIDKNNNERAFCLRTAKDEKLYAVYIFNEKNKFIKMPSNTAVKSSNVINLDIRE
jgi:hypothetical protein